MKSSLNLGLPDNLKKAFPKVVPVNRPEYTFKGNINPYWVAGFTSGDGSFNIKINKAKNTEIGRVQLRFAIHLHLREKEVIEGLAAFFNLNISRTLAENKDSKSLSVKDLNYKYIYFTKNSVAFQVVNTSHILDIIIPFFDKYPLDGIKSLDFADFKIVAEIVKTQKHLTSEGFNQILKIKAGMNLERV